MVYFKRLGVLPIGTGSGTAPTQAHLVLSTTSISQTISTIEDVTELPFFTLTSGNSGTFNGPQFVVSYTSGSGWLTLDISVDPDGMYTVIPYVHDNFASLGLFQATITVSDTNADNGPLTVAINATIQSRIVADRTSVSVSLQDETDGSEFSILISNAGQGVMAAPTIGTISYNGSFPSWKTAPAITSNGDGTYSLKGTPSAVAGTIGGPYTATIPILSTGAVNTSYNIVVTMYVQAVGLALVGLSDVVDDATFIIGGADPGDEFFSIFSTNGVPLVNPKILSYSFSGPYTDWAVPTVVGAQGRIQYHATGHVTGAGVSYIDTLITGDNADPALAKKHTAYIFSGTVPGNPPAQLRIYPNSLALSFIVGQNAPVQSVVVDNAGSGGLAALGTVSLSLVPSVAYATLSYDSATGIATLTPATSALSVGQYTTSIQVTASLAGNSPLTAPVQFNGSATGSAVQRHKYTPPNGVTQNVGTGYYENAPTGITLTRPAHYNTAANYVVSGATVAAQLQSFKSALAATTSLNNPVIEIPAGMVISGANILLQMRTGTGACVIRTSGYASLQAKGTRILPSRDNQYLATISSPTSQPAIRTMPYAANYYFYGIKFTDSTFKASGTSNYGQVYVVPSRFDTVLQDYTNDFLSDQSNNPHDIYFDQCYGVGNLGTRKWLQLTADRVAFTDSYFEGYRNVGFECQVVNANVGGSYHYYHNNFFEAQGENVMYGGGAIPFNTDSWNPTDIYFKQCHFRGRWEWFSWHPTYDGVSNSFKNLFEIKRGHRILADGCVFNRGGKGAQAGVCIVLKSDNNGPNAPSQSATSDVQLIDCYGYDMQRPLGVLGNSSPAQGRTVPNDRHHIMNCMFERLDVPPNNGTGYLVEVGNGASNIDIDHCTFVANGGVSVQGAFSFLGGSTYNLTFTDNIIPKGTYGISSGTGQFLLSALNTKCPGFVWTRNVHPGTWSTAEKSATGMPAGNFYPTSEGGVGYVNYTGYNLTDYALTGASLYKDTDLLGNPAGADVAKIATRITGVESP
jgi:hypothetical protein